MRPGPPTQKKTGRRQAPSRQAVARSPCTALESPGRDHCNYYSKACEDFNILQCLCLCICIHNEPSFIEFYRPTMGLTRLKHRFESGPDLDDHRREYDSYNCEIGKDLKSVVESQNFFHTIPLPVISLPDLLPLLHLQEHYNL